MDFSKQNIVVTGGGSGIGRAAVLRFAQLGGRVAVVDQNRGAAETVASEAGNGAIAVEADVSNSSQVREMVNTVVGAFGGIDVLCNNAGFGFLGTVLDIDEDAWDRLMSVNLKGVFLCSKYALPALVKSGAGRIVNTSSYTALVGIPNRAAYVASKGGISALTRAMALDHADAGVRVNAVAPGTVDSPYFSKIIAEADDPQAVLDELNGRAPMHRMGRPEEIAEAIVWLASKNSSFATGSVLTIDGGSSAW
jgi:NAD(P)-dependent dehydrogenase (short-subunit alcohol dehydrogenase family)